MLPLDARSSRRRRGGRPRRFQAVAERLEGRELMAYTSLGYSLPDLTVSGIAAPTAAYGGSIAVTVNVRNIAATTLPDPLAQEPGSTAHADASPPVRVNIYLTRTRKLNDSAVLIGTINGTNGLAQNGLFAVSATGTLPARPPGFPASGNVFIAFQVDPAAQIPDLDRTNNVAFVRRPVRISPAAGAAAGVQPVALELPTAIQPGDTVQPNIRVENFGTAESGPVVVDLVSSPTRRLTGASTVVARYSIPTVPPLSLTPSSRFVAGDVNLNPPGANLVPASTTTLNTVSYFNTTTTQPNIVTVYGEPIQIPASVGRSYLGLVIEGAPAGTQLSQVYHVAKVRGLPIAGVLTDPAPEANQFPIPPYGAINQS